VRGDVRVGRTGLHFGRLRRRSGDRRLVLYRAPRSTCITPSIARCRWAPHRPSALPEDRQWRLYRAECNHSNWCDDRRQSHLRCKSLVNRDVPPGARAFGTSARLQKTGRIHRANSTAIQQELEQRAAYGGEIASQAIDGAIGNQARRRPRRPGGRTGPLFLLIKPDYRLVRRSSSLPAPAVWVQWRR
jgi:hypothetical protein